MRTAVAGPAGTVHPDDLAPPGWQRMREMRLAPSAHLAGLGPVGPRGPEDGPPALVLPGFLAGDRTTMDIRRALARAGWRVYPWELGLNRGAKADTLELLGRRLDEIYDGRRDSAGRLEPRRDVRAANSRIVTRRRCGAW